MTPQLLGRLATLCVLIAAICGTFQALAPAYLSLGNFQGMLRAVSVSGIVAAGLTFVIVLRKFDLALAGIASFSAMSLGFAMAETNSFPAIMAAALGAGLFCGLISGVLVAYVRLPDVVTTIAVGSIAYGMAFVYNGGGDFSKNFFSSGMVQLNSIKFLGLQMPVLILFLTFVLAGIALHCTRFGNAFYATGENEKAAWLSGIHVRAVVTAGFAICGALVGLAMLLQIAGIGSSRVTAGGQIMLPAYTSVYLGAALFGRASIPATLAGASVMTMLLNGFTLLSVPYYYSDAMVSFILVASILAFDPKFLTLLKDRLLRQQQGA